MEAPSGIVFDIKKFSLHDGPGIRTTIFLKGCPLYCAWCHNPEGRSSRSEILFFENRCITCLDCLEACEYQAIAWVDGTRLHYPENCQACGLCAEVCPSEALQLVGTRMKVEDIISEIEKDVIYYDQSGGGATFSGGEPLQQIEFLTALLAGCKDRGIHTVVDTCGHAPGEHFSRITPLVDLFLYDLKLMDPELHQQFTGVHNQLIFNNLVALVQDGAAVVVRIPIIPGVNDHDANLEATGKFLASLGSLQGVNILPYHRSATDKYRRMHTPYRLSEVHPPSGDHMKRIAAQLESFGLTVTIGG